MPATATDSVVIRPTTPADTRAVERLAQLDSARVPAGELLLAEVGGELRAALSLRERAAIADPFAETAGLVALLRARADHLAGRRRHRRAGRRRGAAVTASGRARPVG